VRNLEKVKSEAPESVTADCTSLCSAYCSPYTYSGNQSSVFLSAHGGC